MARVNLYVPGGLLRRAQRLRDDGQLSLIFRDALEAELRRAQWRRREQADLEADLDIVALRRRFLEDRGTYYRAGYSVALRYAEQTSYAAMRYYESLAWNRDAVVEHLPQLVQRELEQLESEHQPRQFIVRNTSGELSRTELKQSLENIRPHEASRGGVRLEIRQGCVDALRWVWERTMDGVEGDELAGDEPGADTDVLDMLEFGGRAEERAATSKYGALSVFLASQTSDTVTCAFAQIEAIVGDSLPQTARTNRAWWANNPQGHVQARAWLGAGWEVVSVDLSAGTVVFRRRE